MWVQQIKPRHTLWPVRQGAQGKKRWCRPNRAHAVVVHHVTTRTLRLRHLQPQRSIARKIDHLFNCILNLWNNKPVARFGGKGQNGILRNLALQPVNKAFGPRMFAVNQLHRENSVTALRNGASRGSRNRNLRIRLFPKDQTHLRFQREPGRKIFEQTTFDEFRVDKHTHLFWIICGLRSSHGGQHHSNSRQNQTYCSDHWIHSCDLHTT